MKETLGTSLPRELRISMKVNLRTHWSSHFSRSVSGGNKRFDNEAARNAYQTFRKFDISKRMRLSYYQLPS